MMMTMIMMMAIYLVAKSGWGTLQFDSLFKENILQSVSPRRALQHVANRSYSNNCSHLSV
jgi:hypothetical protein